MEHYQYEVSVSFAVTADSFKEAVNKFFQKLYFQDWFVNVVHIPTGEERIIDTENLDTSDERYD